MNFLTKNKKYILIALAIIVVFASVYFFWFRGNGNGREILVIKPADFLQTVSVSGKVIPAESADLGFNKSGKITRVSVVVGQNVGAGQIIAELDSRTAKSELDTARLNLAKAKEIAQSKSESSGLSKNSSDALTAINKYLIDADLIMDELNSIFYDYTVSTYKMSLSLDTDKNRYKTASANYDKAKKAYEKVSAQYRSANGQFTDTQVSTLLAETIASAQLSFQSLKDAKAFVFGVYNGTSENFRSADLVSDNTNIETWTQTIDSDISSLSSSRNAITNSVYDIQSLELVVKQKEYAYQDCFVRAPFGGTITRLDIKTGEQATAGATVISMISYGLYQVESYVPEINIANLAVGNPAEVTLDAYGATAVFLAKIISIDPAETVKDGVSTYKTKLQFLAENSRIKPGMTANLIITSIKKSNTISVPAGAILDKQNQKIVKILVEGKEVERVVTLGEIGALGQTEILSGLKTGDKVIVNPPTN